MPSILMHIKLGNHKRGIFTNTQYQYYGCSFLLCMHVCEAMCVWMGVGFDIVSSKNTYKYIHVTVMTLIGSSHIHVCHV